MWAPGLTCAHLASSPCGHSRKGGEACTVGWGGEREAVHPPRGLESGNSVLRRWAGASTQNAGREPQPPSPGPAPTMFLWVSSLTSDSPFLFRETG